MAEARGAILIYPETVGGFWDTGGHAALGWREPRADDSGAIAAMLASVREQYAIDPRGMFLVGYDIGGDMAYKLACEGVVAPAAIATVSTLMWSFSRDACEGRVRPVSVLLIHGRRDDALPVGGGRWLQTDGYRLSASDVLDFWRDVDTCGARTAEGRGGSQTYSCASETTVAYVGVDRGGHDWFRSGQNYQLNTTGVDAAALVDQFLFDRPNFALPNPRPSGGRARDYLVYAPPNYDASRPTPVVVMLHGRPSNATAMALITRMNQVAARQGFMVVYPEGVGNQWNTHFDLARQRAVIPQDDVAFLETLMGDLAVDLNIDRQRMYVAGYSNGGFMAMRMSCSAADTFAAFATIGGAELYPEMNRECRRGPPAPMLFMHGTGDPSIPYEGVEVPDPQGGDPRRITMGVQDTVAFFVRKNGCSMSGVSTTYAESGRSPGTQVVRFVPNDCAPNAPIYFYLINGGGHTWPGVTGILEEEYFGPTNMDMNAGEVIWEFFREQILPPDGRRG